MKVTVDSVGRVLLPKAVRDALGLRPGASLDVSSYGSGVQLVPGGRTAQLIEEDGVLVASGSGTLDDEDIVRLIDAGRK